MKSAAQQAGEPLRKPVAFFFGFAGAHRRLALVLLGATVLTIAVADWYAGIEVSLAIFYLVPIMLATAWFGWRTGAVFIALSLAVRLISDILDVTPRHFPAFTGWNALAETGTFVLIVWLLNSLLAMHHSLEARIAERTRELREAAAKQERLEREILEVGARERGAVGRELHDDLGQHLTATALAAKALTQRLGQHPEAARAQSIVRWIEEGISKARKLARSLLLEEIEPERLPQELRELALGLEQGAARCQVDCKGPVEASGAACAQLFRIAQESVANALRHGRPGTVRIALEGDATALSLEVADDGCGFDPSGRGNEGYGLQIMEHRARVIGASFSIVSSPGRGTKVLCRLPIQPARLP